MKKIQSKGNNPFLTDKADALWERLDKEGKPISKKDLFKRVKAAKEKK